MADAMVQSGLAISNPAGPERPQRQDEARFHQRANGSESLPGR